VSSVVTRDADIGWLRVDSVHVRLGVLDVYSSKQVVDIGGGGGR
jgi:hypothetical protein